MSPRIDELLNDLVDKKSRSKAVQELAEIGEPAVGKLFEAFLSKDRSLKSGAREAIQSIGKSAIPFLKEKAVDPQKEARIAAMKLIGEIDCDDEDVLRLLTDRIRSNSEAAAVGKAAFEALLSKGDQAIPYLIKISTLHMRWHAFIDNEKIVKRFGRKLIPAMFETYEHETSDEFLADASSLYFYFDPTLIPPLLRLLDKKYSKPFMLAAGLDAVTSGMPFIRNMAWQIPSHHRGSLCLAIQSANKRLSIGKDIPSENLILIVNYLKSSDYFENVAALLCLAHSARPYPEFMPVLNQYLDAEDEGILACALVALGNIGVAEPQIIERMVQHLYHESGFIKQTAIAVFQNMEKDKNIQIPEVAKKAQAQVEDVAEQSNQEVILAIGSQACSMRSIELSDEEKAVFSMCVIALCEASKQGSKETRITAIRQLALIGPAILHVVQNIDKLPELETDPDVIRELHAMLAAIGVT